MVLEDTNLTPPLVEKPKKCLAKKAGKMNSDCASRPPPVLSQAFCQHDGQHAVHMPSHSVHSIDDGHTSVMCRPQGPFCEVLAGQPQPRIAPHHACTMARVPSAHQVQSLIRCDHIELRTKFKHIWEATARGDPTSCLHHGTCPVSSSGALKCLV